MRFATLENEKITNIIELEPHVSYVFPDSVAVPENILAGIGDTYHDGRFYHENPETHEEEEILPYDPMAEMQKGMNSMISESIAASPMILSVGDLYQAMSPTLQTNLPESAGLFASSYRIWKGGEKFAQWELISHKNIAYQVQQDTTAQEHQPPDATGMLAVYVPYVVADASGVKPWAYGAHYSTGDLVRKDGVVWEAKKDMKPCVWEPTEGNEWTRRDDK